MVSTMSADGRTAGDVSRWDASTTLAALAANRRAKNLAEARDLVLVTRYCQLNATPDEVQVEGRAVVPGCERMIHPGGVGTPLVREFALADLAARMHRSHDATRAFVADALDLRYRLPCIWRRLTAGEIEIWRARGVARATRDLSVDAARTVDTEVARIVDSIGPRRLERVVGAAVIAADPDEAEQTTRDRDDRQVQVLPTVRDGRKDVFIRADVADVIRFEAAVDFVADLLGLDGAVEPKAVRRSRAVGLVADPNAVLDLFARTRGSARSRLADHRLRMEQGGGGEPADPVPAPWWTRQDRPAGDGDRQFPTARLVVHMNQSTFWWDTRDPCRVEDPGNPGAPITAEQAFELLGHSRVTLQPVLDLNGMAPVDGYEVRGRLRQSVVLKSAGACPFPYCDTFSRHQQCDHTISWPRGPTDVGNLAVADTRHHRVKTHSRWQVRQPFPGTFVWKDPYGQCYLVDHTGTREVPVDQAA